LISRFESVLGRSSKSSGRRLGEETKGDIVEVKKEWEIDPRIKAQYLI
jgi:hypothetical protein